MRRLVALVGPLLVTIALLVAVEGGLRVAGFEANLNLGGDAKANLLPLFQPATDRDGTPIYRRKDLPAVSFRRDKPANGLRVFVLGESPVLGWPFGTEYAFPQFLGDRLAAAFPDRVVEVVNCGLNGIGSFHVRRLLEEEVVRHAPDVLVIYTGHGDWLVPRPVEIPALLRRLADVRLVQLAAVADARWRRWRHGQFDAQRLKALNDPFGYARQRARGELTLSHAEAERIVQTFTTNLRAMVRAGERAGATMVLGTLSQNYRDFPPGASRHRPGLGPEDRARWRTLVEQAAASAATADCQTALVALDSALGIDPRPALTYYDRARCLDRLGRYGDARTGYRLASDRDEVPMGARGASNDAIRAVAAETGVQLVDVDGALAAVSNHALIGQALFFDHAHPTFAGHVAIARTLATALGAPGGTWPDPAGLEAAHPELVKQAWAGRILVYVMLGWYDLADRTVDEEARRFPDLAAAPEKVAALRDGIARLRRDDPSLPPTDFPDASD
jgi:lysophospholipase L1-like esterase